MNQQAGMVKKVKSTEEVRLVFGKKLLDAIRDADMNQSELARRLGISKDACSSYVRGRCLPKPETLARICSELGVTQEDLLPRRFDSAPTTERIKLVSMGPDAYFLSINIIVSLKEATDIMSLLPAHQDAITNSD
jgi:transcriptional regulator with XRE-family HTH domain